MRSFARTQDASSNPLLNPFLLPLFAAINFRAAGMMPGKPVGGDGRSGRQEEGGSRRRENEGFASCGHGLTSFRTSLPLIDGRRQEMFQNALPCLSSAP